MTVEHVDLIEKIDVANALMGFTAQASISAEERRGLLAAARAGDTVAFERLYARHKGPLYRYLLRQCQPREAAADANLAAWDLTATLRSELATCVLSALGELARVSGVAMLPHVDMLLPLIIEIASHGLSETRIGDPMHRVGGRRHVAARQLVIALGPRFHASELPFDREVDRLIVADLEVQERVMLDLAARKGFSVTRYQGRNVIFRAKEHVIYLVGKPSMVERDSTTLVGDTIQFNDSTQIIIARGDTLVRAGISTALGSIQSCASDCALKRELRHFLATGQHSDAEPELIVDCPITKVAIAA